MIFVLQLQRRSIQDWNITVWKYWLITKGISAAQRSIHITVKFKPHPIYYLGSGLQAASESSDKNKHTITAVSGNVHMNLAMNSSIITIYLLCPHWCFGEGNGNPLQCSCLENPRDRGAWWAAIYGVAQSRTRLERLSSSRLSDLRSASEFCGRSYSMMAEVAAFTGFKFQLYYSETMILKQSPKPS